MQILKIPKGKLADKALVPPSKSYANRALILASLWGQGIRITNLPDATDVTNLIKCLGAIGLNPEWAGTNLCFGQSFPDCEGEGELVLDVGEGGTTARFLATLLLLGSRPYTLLLGERLKERPWEEFLDLAQLLGARATLSGRALQVQGPGIFPSSVTIDCAKTTQFATALKLLGIRTGALVIPKNLEVSKSYWRMTEELVVTFAQENSTYTVPRDWSSASYPLAFAALNHRIEFSGLSFDSLQADSKFLILLRSLGCVEETAGSIFISPLLNHRSVELDVSDCLDLVPTLSYFLAHVEGQHRLTGVENLVHKESDRLSEVIRLLSIFDRQANTNGSSILIHGSSQRISRSVDLRLPNDHRMVMAGALFLRHHAGGTIAPAEAVEKSYPRFFDLFVV